MLSKLYHLLQITLLQHFAATPSFLLFYCSKASQNTQLALYSKIGSNCCNIFEVIPFAANDTVLQHFQQLEKNCKKICLNQFRKQNYSCVPFLEVIYVIISKLYHLLQMILFCSIFQQPDDFCKRNISEAIQNV